MKLFIVGLLLQLASFTTSAQSSDSLARSIDSSSQKIKEATTRFNKWQDSQHHAQIQRFTDQNGKNLDKFLADMKDREQKEKQQTYIRIALGIAFLAVVIYALVRRRKQNKSA